MFLNRDPEIAGERCTSCVRGSEHQFKVQVKFFKRGFAHWRILLRQWDMI